jgi:perosamine synthetase
MIEKMLCLKQKTLLDAMQIINENGKGVAFIVDDSQRLCGVLTDGDVRRFLLEGHNLQESVSRVLKGNFVYARQEDSYADMLAKTNDRIQIVPIVDGNMKVVDYFRYTEDIHIPVANPDLKGNELKYLTNAFLSSWISSQGAYIDMFENLFAGYCSSSRGIAVSNGTAALHLALLALGVGKGDEVIVPNLTFAATINAVLHAGATPVAVDIEERSWCIDPKEMERAISVRTKAVIPVHLYGQPCDMDAIMSIAKKRGLFVIEDAAEAHGATFGGKKVGSFGDIGCFSFFANKVITTGEGGMCVTGSPKIEETLRMLRDHGMSRKRKYWHEAVGYNYRMTNLQAAIGVAQLERIDKTLAMRQGIEDGYKRCFSGMDFIEFQHDDLPKRRKITWLVSALIKNGMRDEYIARLRERKVDARPLFYALSKMDIYKPYIFSGKISEAISSMGICFPTHPSVDASTFNKIEKAFISEQMHHNTKRR